MSEENVEIVRKAFDALERRDLAAALAVGDPNIVWNPLEEAPSHGLEAVAAYFERWLTAWQDLKTTPEEFIDAGDHVLVRVLYEGRGQGSGVEVQDRTYQVYGLRDRTVVRMDEFRERSEALEAAGLSE